MTREEVEQLKHFSWMEKRTDGHLIFWPQADHELFRHLDDIRADLGKGIRVIREVHEGRAWPAVDWITSAPVERVVQVVGPRSLSMGVYAGDHGPSYHSDNREVGAYTRPRRWMAVRPKHKERLGSLTELIYSETKEWVYLAWSHPRSFSALLRVMQMAEEHRGRTLELEPLQETTDDHSITP